MLRYNLSMRAALSIIIAIALVTCVELPNVPQSSETDSVALPFVCYAGPLPLVGGWVVVDGDTFEKYGDNLSGWTACSNGEIVSCYVMPDKAIIASDL